MQKHANLVLVKSFPTNIFLKNLGSIQRRASLVKFAHLAEKSGKGSISNLSTKVESMSTAEDESFWDTAVTQSIYKDPGPHLRFVHQIIQDDNLGL